MVTHVSSAVQLTSPSPFRTLSSTGPWVPPVQLLTGHGEVSETFISLPCITVSTPQSPPDLDSIPILLHPQGTDYMVTGCPLGRNFCSCPPPPASLLVAPEKHKSRCSKRLNQFSASRLGIAHREPQGRRWHWVLFSSSLGFLSSLPPSRPAPQEQRN